MSYRNKPFLKNGFSLIELLIVIMLISLLAMMSYPIYSNHFVKAKRIEAQLTLLDLAARIESYPIEDRINQSIDFTPESFGVSSTTKSGGHHIKIQGNCIEQYCLIAESNFQDKKCTQLSYNYQGERKYKGDGSYKECWCG